MKFVVTPLRDVPLIHKGDNLVKITLNALDQSGEKLQDGDILVYAQKVISKSEGRLRNLATVVPSGEAIELAKEVKKSDRLVELILQESNKIIRAQPGVLIVEHKCGFICANAGIDRSNVTAPEGQEGDWVLLLPEDSDLSARNIQEGIRSATSKKVGVLIIDSHSRPWRIGSIGHTIGLANVPAVIDLRGQKDLFGYTLQFSIVGAADELAASASLVMGQKEERTPIVHVRGFPYPLRESSMRELIRPVEEDLFR